ncbi:hypothetical protein HFP71_13705 [Streptomyces sp. ARC32]
MHTLRRRRECLEAAVALFPEDGSELRELLEEPTATTAVLAPRFAAYVRARVAGHGVGDPAVRRLLALYGGYRRLVERAGTPDPPHDDVTPVDVSGLRGLVSGRSVCVVSNAADVAGSTLGAEIDGYDLVVRCDTFRIRARGTGERTGLHAVSLRGDAPWQGPPGPGGPGSGSCSATRRPAGAAPCGSGSCPARRTTSRTPRCAAPSATRRCSARTGGVRPRPPRSPCSGCWTSWTRVPAWTSSASRCPAG